MLATIVFFSFALNAMAGSNSKNLDAAESYKAFDFALELSRFCSGASPEISDLSVAQPPEPIDIVEMDAIIDRATQHYEALFKELRGKAKANNIEFATEIVVGHPADQIIKYARKKRAT